MTVHRKARSRRGWLPLAALAALAWAGPPVGSLPPWRAGFSAWLANPPVDARIAEAAALLAWGCLVYLCAATALVALSHRGGAAGRLGGAVARRCLPAMVRRIAEAALGVSILTGGIAAAATPALAQPRPAVPYAAAAAPGVSLTGSTGVTAASPFDRLGTAAGPDLPAPDRIAPVTGRLLGAQSRVPASDQAVVVVRGDTLWSIAASHLPPGAGSARIAAEWHRWYDANRAVVGADPDLILPGQRLTAPPAPG